MNKKTYPPCNSHAIHSRMSDFAPEDVISPFAETDSRIGEVASVVHSHCIPIPLVEILMEEEAVRSVVRGRLEASGESNDEEEMIAVLEEVKQER